MKKTLFGKLFFVYLLIIFISFSLTTLLTTKLITDYLISEKKISLEKDCTLIVNDLINDIETNSLSNSTFRHFTLMARSSNIRIWYVDYDGYIRYDSSGIYDNFRLSHFDDSFDDALIYNRFSTVGNFYNFFTFDVITVGHPISYRSKYYGTIILHTSLSDITATSMSIYMISLFCLIITLFLAFTIIYLFTRKLIKPLKDMNSAALKYADGNFDTEIIVNTEDEIGQLAKSFNTMSYELKELETFRQRFIQNISHDFRSPLTSIKGYATAISDGTIEPDQQDKYLNIIIDETDRLAKLTSDILFLTKMESHNITLDYTDFDIQVIIKKIIILFEQKCVQKNINVNFLKYSNTLFVHADIDRIQQVLYNLFDNAVKFSFENETITIETTKSNNIVNISIKNVGEQIKEKDYKYIFNRFFKTDVSRSQYKGTGLGLSIVKEIINLHNQKITVNSNSDYTIFSFSLKPSNKKDIK